MIARCRIVGHFPVYIDLPASRLPTAARPVWAVRVGPPSGRPVRSTQERRQRRPEGEPERTLFWIERSGPNRLDTLQLRSTALVGLAPPPSRARQLHIHTARRFCALRLYLPRAYRFSTSGAEDASLSLPVPARCQASNPLLLTALPPTLCAIQAPLILVLQSQYRRAA